MTELSITSAPGDIKLGATITMPGRERRWGRFLRWLGLRRGPVKPWVGKVVAITTGKK